MLKSIISIFIFINVFTVILSAQVQTTSQDTITTESGLKYIIMQKGNGTKVELGKEVGFHYTGYFTSGEMFATSRGSEPFFFVTGKRQVIKGAEEGISLMNEGDRYIFIMPPFLAYGEKGVANVIPPNSTLVFDYEIVSVTDPKLSLADTLYSIINKEGSNKAVELYYNLKINNADKYSFRESSLNNLGYKLMREAKFQESIAILELNVKEYPQSWNVFDSLAEAYMNAGDNDKAIENYEKSLLLNPDNKAGKEMIDKLRKK